MPRLTKALVEGAELPAKGYKVIWDDKVAGYGVRLTPSGVRAYVAQGRVHGRVVIATIGRHGLFTEDQARRKAQAILQGMRDGVDPNAEKKAAAEAAKAEVVAGVTLAEVLDEYIKHRRPRAVTAAEYRRHVNVSLAAWKDEPLQSVTRDMVLARNTEIERKGVAGKRAAPVSARAAMTTFKMLYGFAARRYRHPEGTAIFTNNPTEVLFDVWATQKPKKRTERYVRPDKLGAVWVELDELRASLHDWQSVAGVDVARFAFLTGCRRREVTTLTWDRVDLRDDPAKCRFKLVNRKRGDDIWLPLNDLAVELLKQRQPLSDSRYVFPSRAPRGHIDDARAAMQKVSEVAGQTLSLHDARRTFSNIALRCRVGKYEVDMLTGHEPSQSDVTSSAYLDLTDRTWLHDASQKVADVIRLEAAKAAGTNVVALESRA